MRHLILVAVGVAFAAACSDNPAGSDTSLTATQRTDLAVAAGQSISGDVSQMSHTDSDAGVLFAFGGNLGNDTCTLNLGDLDCTATLGPLQGEATLTFSDAAGAAQTSYDEQTTATATIVTEISGSLTQSNFSLEFDHNGNFTVTGLEGSETSRTWSGSATTSFSSSTFGGGRSYSLSSSSELATVVVPTSGTEPRWPTSGRITATIVYQANGASAASGTVTAQVDFNGTAQVPLTVANHHYTLDLASHTVIEAN